MNGPMRRRRKRKRRPGMTILAALPGLLLWIAVAAAQEGEPGSWPEEVDAVVIRDLREFRVRSPKDATYGVHRRIRVNNERGKEYGEVIINESKYKECRHVEGRIEDLEGKILRELEEDEILETTRSPGYVLYDDDRYRHFELGWSRFPYIVDYRYEVAISTLLSWPDWYPQEDVPVLESSYALTIRNGIGYRTHTVGINVAPVVVEGPGETVSKWRLEKIEPRIDESRMPPGDEVQMALRFAPDRFGVEHSAGSFSSWQSLADWYAGLSSGRYLLPDDVRRKIRRMVAGTPDEVDRIRDLYAFLQAHTRYVAIELGVGHWQPSPSSVVYENQYGDCKDLSTLMIAMLGEAGIEAWPALIRTRDLGPLIPEFPSSQFNHVITCVPTGSDTVWLECTSDIMPAGELPYADEGSEVLLVSGEGSRLVRTPQSGAESNRWRGRVEGTLGADGTLTLTGSVAASGNTSDWLRGVLHDSKPAERRRTVARILSRFVPKLDLTSCEIDNLSPRTGEPVTLAFEASVDRFGVRSQDRLFLNPNLIHRETAGDVPKETERQFPIYYNYAYMQEDSTVIAIPEGYSLEAAPDPLDMRAPFGEFRTSHEFRDGTLRYHRMLRIDQNEIPPPLYEEYRSFIKAVVSHDRSSFVLAR